MYMSLSDAWSWGTPLVHVPMENKEYTCTWWTPTYIEVVGYVVQWSGLWTQELTHRADTLIGDDIDGRVAGVSGGERRRISVGIGLVTDPSVIFLDEPTTGLDSDSALAVVKVLKRLAQRGCTVGSHLWAVATWRMTELGVSRSLVILQQGISAFVPIVLGTPSFCYSQLNCLPFLIFKHVQGFPYLLRKSLVPLCCKIYAPLEAQTYLKLHLLLSGGASW